VLFFVQSGVWPVDHKAIPDSMLAKPESSHSISSSSSLVSSQPSSRVPAHLLDAPECKYRPAVAAVSGLQSNEQSSPILPLPIFHLPSPRLTKSGKEKKGSRPKRKGGLLTLESAWKEIKQKEERKAEKKIEKEKEKERKIERKEQKKKEKEKNTRSRQQEKKVNHAKRNEDRLRNKGMKLIEELQLLKQKLKLKPEQLSKNKKFMALQKKKDNAMKVWANANALLNELQLTPTPPSSDNDSDSEDENDDELNTSADDGENDDDNDDADDDDDDDDDDESNNLKRKKRRRHAIEPSDDEGENENENNENNFEEADGGGGGGGGP
jgi:hypothetical protein